MEAEQRTPESTNAQQTSDNKSDKAEKTKNDSSKKSSSKSSTRDYGELCMALVTVEDDGTRTFVVPPDQPEFSRIRECEDYIKEAVKQSDQQEFHAAVLRIKRDYKVVKEVQTKVSFNDVS